MVNRVNEGLTAGVRPIFEQIMEINLTKVIGYMLDIFNSENLALVCVKI